MKCAGGAAAALCGILLGGVGLAAPSLANDSLIDTEYFYAEIEGGYASTDGFDVLTPSGSIETDEGFYGTVLLGHEDPHTGIFKGFVDRAEIWFSFSESNENGVSVPAGVLNAASPTTVQVESRTYEEYGARFQHYFVEPVAQPSKDKYEPVGTSNASNVLWGIEPFYGRFEQDIAVTGIAGTSVSTLESDIAGALLSLEGEWALSDVLTVLARAAGGIYHGETESSLTGFLIDPTIDYTGFRGQLALGLRHDLSEIFSIGVISRFDYFSDVGNLNAGLVGASLSTDDYYVFSIGAFLNIRFPVR
jgi:hypothetical protein